MLADDSLLFLIGAASALFLLAIITVYRVRDFVENRNYKIWSTRADWLKSLTFDHEGTGSVTLRTDAPYPFDEEFIKFGLQAELKQCFEIGARGRSTKVVDHPLTPVDYAIVEFPTALNSLITPQCFVTGALDPDEVLARHRANYMVYHDVRNKRHVTIRQLDTRLRFRLFDPAFPEDTYAYSPWTPYRPTRR